ncbi:MAG: calcium-binding protein [Microcoleaceae cyanobacterium]
MTIIGTSNRDILNGTLGDDTLLGGAGDDLLRGRRGDDQLFGGEGDDRLAGNPGDDTIDGGPGADRFVGGSGNDLLRSATFEPGDFLSGGNDDNTEAASSANDIVTGDTVDLSLLELAGIENLLVDLDIENQGALNGNPPSSQNGVLRITQDGETFEIQVENVENIIGSAFGEVLFGNNENNVILAGAGDDVLHAFGGTDFIDGGEGTDILLLNGANGGVTIDLEAGTVGPNTFVNIENASGSVNFGDQIFGDAGENELLGNGGDDLLRGRDGVDTLRGGEGNDTLIGDRGDDQQFGDNGDDRFIWNNGDGSDLMEGGAGFDITEVNGSVDLGDEFVLGANGDRAMFQRNNLGLFALDVNDIERFEINGGGGNDSLDLNDLTGTDVETVFFSGGAGHDTLDARDSETPVEAQGDSGRDRLLGGAGDDTLSGGADNDVLQGRAGNDLIFGGEGHDRLAGNRGDDTLNGGSGSDTLRGAGGADRFVFDGDPFDGADVSAPGRDIIGNEDFIIDFAIRHDQFVLNADDFLISDELSFFNGLAADLPSGGANVIVLQNSDNDDDPDTPFIAGTAANLIAESVDEAGAGFFVYFNSNLGVNRLVYSTDLSDAGADLKIVNRLNNLEGQDAIDALPTFTEDNFSFV